MESCVVHKGINYENFSLPHFVCVKLDPIKLEVATPVCGRLRVIKSLKAPEVAGAFRDGLDGLDARSSSGLQPVFIVPVSTACHYFWLHFKINILVIYCIHGLSDVLSAYACV